MQTLKDFLEDRARPKDTLRYHELQGFLFTVAHAPEAITPSEWIPIVFNDQEAGFADDNEANAVLTELMSLYNDVCSGGDDGFALPADCTFREEILANLEEDAPVSQWCRGFVLGHDWLEDVWSASLDDELDQEFGLTVFALSFFASRETAEVLRGELESPPPLQELASTLREAFPDALTDYADVARDIRTAALEVSPEPRRVDKVGRNDPCPCGSGRKYKKCCGAG